MSIKGMLDRIDLSAPVPNPADTRRATPRTAPGHLMQFSEELDAAQRKLDSFAGSLPTKRLDPVRIRPSAMRNRHDDAFTGPTWAAFKSDIEQAGGNVQPIKVRPIKASDFDYEIVFGHRRHRACLESGIQVLATIEEVGDRDLYEAMTRENVGRNDLSVWEWGQHYKRGLDIGLYDTQARLAAANQMSPGHVAMCLQIANLASEVVAAFPSPLDIQWRWGAKLVAAQAQDASGLKARALAVVAQAPRPNAAKTFSALVPSGDVNTRGKTFEIQRNGKRAALIEAKGSVVSVRFSKGAVPAKRLDALKVLVDQFLADEPVT